MNKLDIVTVYLFFIRGKKELYAFTTSKVVRDGFLKQRNPSCFNVIKKKMDELDFSTLAYQNKNKMLCELPLNSTLDKNESISIISNYWEEFILNERCDQIDKEMEELSKYLLSIDWKKDKYRDSITYISNITYFKKDNNGKKTMYSKISLLSVFRDTFKNTFEKSDFYDPE